jgi:hypothetical protein
MTPLYPSSLKFSKPPTADEIWIIQHENRQWNPSANNPTPGSTAFGLGQITLANRTTIAAQLSKQVGFSVNPYTTDPNLQLEMMRMYIVGKYKTAARAREAWQEHQRTDPRGGWY